jgi:hypothetical protein
MSVVIERKREKANESVVAFIDTVMVRLLPRGEALKLVTKTAALRGEAFYRSPGSKAHQNILYPTKMKECRSSFEKGKFTYRFCNQFLSISNFTYNNSPTTYNFCDDVDVSSCSHRIMCLRRQCHPLSHKHR